MVKGDCKIVIVYSPEFLKQQLGLAACIDEQQCQPVGSNFAVKLGNGIARCMAGPGDFGFGFEDANVRSGARFGGDKVGKGDVVFWVVLRVQVCL